MRSLIIRMQRGSIQRIHCSTVRAQHCRLSHPCRPHPDRRPPALSLHWIAMRAQHASHVLQQAAQRMRPWQRRCACHPLVYSLCSMAAASPALLPTLTLILTSRYVGHYSRAPRAVLPRLFASARQLQCQKPSIADGCCHAHWSPFSLSSRTLCPCHHVACRRCVKRPTRAPYFMPSSCRLLPPFSSHPAALILISWWAMTHAARALSRAQHHAHGLPAPQRCMEMLPQGVCAHTALYVARWVHTWMRASAAVHAPISMKLCSAPLACCHLMQLMDRLMQLRMRAWRWLLA